MPLPPLSGNPLQSRNDVQRAVRDLISPLLPYFSAGSARVRLGDTGARHDRVAAELEGFARPLWALAPLEAGGGAFEHWQVWREGLANGTDPDHPEYWGDPFDNEQRLVDLAAIGFALCLVPEILWEPLDARSRASIVAYLKRAHGCTFANCNWKFFRIMIGMGLSRIGETYDEDLHLAYFRDIDSYYLGNGWYRDGPGRRIDHYIAFAFHFYGLFYAQLGGDAERAEIYRQRARAFVQDFRHWFAEDGAALPYGRSLSYRFAHASFWGALAFADLEALPWGQIKGYYLRNLRWWAERPIFDRDGVLSVGYAYPNLLMSESYNSPGSPYWAMKACLPLALPEGHPFWAAEEVSAPKHESPVPQSYPGMVLQQSSGHTVALVSGPENVPFRHIAEKYAKFAYSTRYAFSVELDERHFASAVSDNMLSFSEDGLHIRMRERCTEVQLAGDVLYSRWQAFEDVQVETWLIPAGAWHLRVHAVTTPRHLHVVEGGFAVSKPDNQNWIEVIEDASASVRTDNDISAIAGFDHRRPQIISPLANTNLMSPRTLVPQLRGIIEPGTTQLASAVAAQPASVGYVLPPPPEAPDIENLRRLFAEEGRLIPLFDRD